MILKLQDARVCVITLKSNFIYFSVVSMQIYEVRITVWSVNAFGTRHTATIYTAVFGPVDRDVLWTCMYNTSIGA